MNINSVLDFISDLIQNNNREWFAENKKRYDEARAYFEQISSKLVVEIAGFDKELAHVEAKDCIFRIYRDIRFSHDKTPYKNHFGVFMAAGGGRKVCVEDIICTWNPVKALLLQGSGVHLPLY